MACFLVPMAEAIVVTVVKNVVEKKEKDSQVKYNKQTELVSANETGLSWSHKLSWLTKLLWGGVALLAFEHLWHGEIVPWPPFLTAMKNPADIAPMLYEIATIGTSMAVFVTLIWIVMVLVADHKVKSISKNVKVEN